MKFGDSDQIVFETWVLRQGLEKSTFKTYLQCLKKYCEVTGMTPVELITEAEAEEESGIRMRNRRINLHLLKFRKALEDENKAPSTINLYYYAIRSFYDAMDIELPRIRRPSGDICLEQNYGRLITRKELRALVSMAPPREKALIYLMALSGMAQAEARRLTIRKFLDAAGDAIGRELKTVEDLFEAEDELREEIITLDIVRKKVNYRYMTFIPPEATREIINYLKERMYGRNEKIRVRDYERALFVKRNGEDIDRDIIVTNFRRIGLEAGFKKRDGAYSFWRAHALRKYFISTIINKIGDKILADFLAGHKISDVDRAYWYMDPEDLKRRYMKALPYLSIDGVEVRTIEDRDYRRLREVERIYNQMKDEIRKTEKLIQLFRDHPEFKEILSKRTSG
ncbi:MULTISPECIES: tyrosine-type recombinase/integrase [Methanothermobacter]|uniref:Tyrosine-type recombinase/integrase n=1 Tax=Methanothermobacter wolfeii TaxID=145261 RepID=A0A9E7RR86_METWO|nr:tyrosine-type recombinase/integrase [Methanothermobacter wolfeii]UXH31030.1 tyrosine-type recombinase/integrase [Methanothermobacter wolfeii]